MTSSSDTDIHPLPRTKVVVQGLKSGVSSTDLRLLFGACGSITSIKITRKGFAFLYFEKESSAKRALEYGLGSSLFDGPLTVDYARIPPLRQSYHRTRGKVGIRPSSRRINQQNNEILVIYEEPFFRAELSVEEDFKSFNSTFNFQGLMDIFPHLASQIFYSLDRVTLIRCLFVSKRWRAFITRLLDEERRFKSRYLSGWKAPTLTPLVISPSVSEDVTFYRNILCIKADHSEIALALDNGNVEFYDRHSLKRTCVLVGQCFSSPDSLDFNKDIVLVGYTMGFCGLALARNNIHTKSLGWSVFERKTKTFIKYVEKDHRYINIFIGYDSCLYIVMKNSILSLSEYGKSGSRPEKILSVPAETDFIEAVDLGCGKIIAAVNCDDVPSIKVWAKPYHQNEKAQLNSSYAISSSPHILSSKIDLKNVRMMSIQVHWPFCLLFLTNNFGTFEYYENRGRPFVLIVLCHLERKETLRIINIDEVWMLKHKIVPFDYDSCVMSAKFSLNHLVVGFGSSSNRRDGGIGVWSFSELLNFSISDDELNVYSLPAPFYHWNGVDGHVGGVSSLYLDEIGLIAGNSCSHQVSTRCIETYDEEKKDNILIYDFWDFGKDNRRSV